VLCFPFIFAVPLDGRDHDQRGDEACCGAARSRIAMAEQSDIVAAAYGDDQELKFGPEVSDPNRLTPAYPHDRAAVAGS
jgi:malate dehydrogenase (oxaloacetate-decarboxylating)(NADP+)